MAQLAPKHLLDPQGVFDAALRQDFPTFLAKAVHELIGPGFKDNWHLHAIGYALGGVRETGGGRLIVTVPPRSLKSMTITIAWVAWMLGRDPSLKFCTVSYSAELALQHSRDCRRLMQCDWYRRIFPRTVLERMAEQDLKTTAGGGRYTTSVSGTMTGLGGDIIIIDDPISAEDGAREVARKHCIEWFSSTLASRLNDKTTGSIILVMQRVHEDDLAGHLLEAGGWEHLNLPAIAREDDLIPIGPGRHHHRHVGDVLHPEREPLSVLEAQKAVMGSFTFEAQYQQAPVPAEGNLVRREWFRQYETAPERLRGDRIVQSWDCASKTGALNDWSVCVTALIRLRDIYILDVYRQRLLFPDLKKQVIARAARHPGTMILIEDAASGTQLLQELQASRPAGMMRPIACLPEHDKVSRFSGASQRIETGEVWLPVNAPWLGDFIHEVVGFPNARHDDQADALSQLLIWNRKRPPMRISQAAIDQASRRAPLRLRSFM